MWSKSLMHQLKSCKNNAQLWTTAVRRLNSSAVMQESDDFDYNKLKNMSLDELDQLQDEVNPEMCQEAYREDDKLQRKIAFKTIERKYFKKPNEVNLLTWDAKEQMRFLNKEYPDVWTVERLADSFPISKDGVIKILKSKYQPKSLDEVVQHDTTVQMHWKALTSKTEKLSRPLLTRYEYIKKSGRMDKLLFAGGNTALPMPNYNFPDKQKYLPDTSGTFAQIVKEYVQQKQPESTEKNAVSLSSEEWKNHNQKLLQDFFKKGKNDQKVQQPSSSSLRNREKHDYREMFQPETNFQNFQSEHDSFEIQSKDVWQSSEVDTDNSRSRSNNSLTKTSGPTPSTEWKGAVPHSSKLSKLNYPGFENTAKVKSIKHNSDDDVPMTVDINVDIDREGAPQGYIYDPEKGYQYVVGRPHSDAGEHISTQDLQKLDKNDTSRLYKNGRYHYDEDGEFLFKTP